MTIWSIEPRDTLVMRDGRSVAGAGAYMTGFPAPYPQATAGLMRTRSSVNEDGAFVIPKNAKKAEHLAHLLEQKAKGPWFGLVDEEGRIEEYLFPAPRDAVFFLGESEKDTHYLRLGRRRQSMNDGECSDFMKVEPLFLSKDAKGKASKGADLWRWSKLQDWLYEPKPLYECHPEEVGASHPIPDTRFGIRIDPETQMAEDGALFTIEHRAFHTFVCDSSGKRKRKFLCLLVETQMQGIQHGVVPFAGKRRSVFLNQAEELSPPSAPEGLFDAIATSGCLRLLLATPAYFQAGWEPSYLLQEKHGVQPKLKAAIVPRPEVVSGWDFAKRKPKPTRRLVSAGAVYFLHLDGTPEARIKWLEEHWWEAISDEEQARNDGYGLALFGVDQYVGEDT